MCQSSYLVSGVADSSYSCVLRDKVCEDPAHLKDRHGNRCEHCVNQETCSSTVGQEVETDTSNVPNSNSITDPHAALFSVLTGPKLLINWPMKIRKQRPLLPLQKTTPGKLMKNR